MALVLSNMITRIRLSLTKKRKPYSLYKQILGFYPRHIELYELSLLHKSMIMFQKNGRRMSNERLEYLGDSVLQTIISDILYRHFPHNKEGFLTLLRAKIVKRETLNQIALDMGLDKLISVSPSTRNPASSSIPGNAFEALIGAIYLDKGYKTCFRFIEKEIINKRIDLDQLAEKESDYKSKLLEWGQKHRLAITFQIIAEEKSANNLPEFTAQVLIDEGLKAGCGKGQSKKQAHQQAAKHTYQMLQTDQAFAQSVRLLKKEKKELAKANSHTPTLNE